MFLRFFYVVACMSASFLFMSQCYSPIWIYSTFHLSIYQLMGIWVVSTFWLFCVMLPWAFMYKFLCDHIFYFSWVCTWVCMWVSVQLICPVMPDSLQPHGLQHTRPPCPLPTPRACSNSGPSSWWCHPTISSSVISFSSCFQSFPASGTFLRIRWPKYWSFSFSISPSNEYSGLISFRMDWLDLIAVQGTLKSLLQYHSSKTSILWHSAFFMVQLSHPYMTTGKTIALTRQIFVSKVMSLLFNMLSRWVIAFLPRSKCYLFFFFFFNFMAAVIICNYFGAQENKV